MQHSMASQGNSLFKHAINKVPEVTLLFWLIKMMSTTVGETAADFLSVNLGFGLAGTTLVMGTLLLVTLFFQLRFRRYIPALYWLTVVLVSVLGTLITDNLTDHLGIPLPVSTLMFSTGLMAVFIVWDSREKTLSIRHIDSISRELFYWLAILTTFALGTAAGDWFAEGLQLGYVHSALIFGGAIAVIAFAHYVYKANAALCFWLAYILTRPFGASLGDWLSQSHSHGGLGLGAINSSALFLVAIVMLVTYLSFSQKRQADNL